MSFVKRLSQDLKKDRKKTIVMLALAVALVGVCAFRIFQNRGVHPKPVVVDAEAVSGAPNSDVTLKGEAEEKSRFPLFLSAALPYEKIGGNPFRAFYLNRDEDKEEPEKKLKEKREEDLAREERSALTTIKVSCTVTGRDAFAVVDGRIMKLGQEYKSFIIEEIGDGYVLFVGQTTSRKIHVPF